MFEGIATGIQLTFLAFTILNLDPLRLSGFKMSWIYISK